MEAVSGIIENHPFDRREKRVSYRSDEEAVKRRLAEISGTDTKDWRLVFKARYGMQVVLEAISAELGPGSVLTQAFTCSTAVSPIIMAGLRPRYADIEESTMMINPEEMTNDETTRAVMLQHTFGIKAEQSCKAIASRARAWGSVVLEDSAHALGLIVRDDNGNALADYSFHSFGVEKMLGTRFGGAVWVNPDSVHSSLRQTATRSLENLSPIGARTSLVSRAFVNQNRILNRVPTRLASPIRKALSDKRLMEPPIAQVEREGLHPYEPAKPSAWMLKRILREFDNFDQMREKRVAASVAISEKFKDAGIVFPEECALPQPYVRFPFFAPTAASARRTSAAVNSAGYFAGHWYRPLLFPGVTDESAFGLTDSEPQLPVSRALSARVVNLLTNVPESSAGKAADVAIRTINNLNVSDRKLGNDDFVPVILGTGLGAYAMARALHEDYGVRSLAIGRAALRETRDSAIVDVRVYPDFKAPDFIVDTILALRHEFEGRKILLIPAIELYTNVVMDNRACFGEQFLIPLPEKAAFDRLMSKTDFYETCEEIGIPHPSTVILTPEQAKDEWSAPNHGYPMIVKAADTDLYQRVHFAGKKKIYKVSGEDELREIVDLIFASDYQADLVLQEYLSGDETVMRIANSYSDRKGKMNFMALGQVVLTELNPALVGNNNAIVAIEDEKLAGMLTRLLEHVGYRGLANFDVMYDVEAREYKVLEANLRAGATHYYVAAAGASIMKHLVQDLVYQDSIEPVVTGNGGLWVNIPYPLVRRFSPEPLRPLLREARNHSTVHTLDYAADSEPKRVLLRRINDALRVSDTLKFRRVRLNE